MALRRATGDLCWLLSHGYAPDSSLKLVGDRYALFVRQRIAVQRCACSDAQAAARRQHRISPEQLRGQQLWLDGYNVLTTIEAALAGGVLLAARDSACRDMASMHGSYRKVAETLPALEILGRHMAALEIAECRWYLDRPVSNSGRLKQIMDHLAATHGWNWRVELVPNPDPLLSTADQAVATSDSVILDHCRQWLNLAWDAIQEHVPQARIVELSV